jgi:hypothetical protein
MLFEQEVSSMQVEHQPVEYAQPGDNGAIRVNQEVKEFVEVYRQQ